MSKNKQKRNRLFFAFIKVYFPLVLVIVLVIAVNSYFNELLAMFLIVNNGEVSSVRELNNILKAFPVHSIFLSFIFVIGVCTSFFHKMNGDRTFNSNGNIYYNHWYTTFYLASYFMGYGQIQLAGVPISMQYKLILRNTFKSIVPDIWIGHYQESDEMLKNRKHIVSYYDEYLSEVEEPVIDQSVTDINVVISDTYKIKFDTLASIYRKNPTLCVESAYTELALRRVDPELANVIREKFDKFVGLYPNVKNVYIFSTTNPVNSLNVANSIFRKFGRFSVVKLYVVQLNDDKIYLDKEKIN